ncbi:MAG: LamG domain-containing protein [Sedimentisphaerales bacterium]|nr:LamG domain-containing protein [Sedimentisphaerales bacterium]
MKNELCVKLMLIVSVVLVLVAAPAFAADPMVHYPLDTDASDVAGGEHDGSLNGNPTFVTEAMVGGGAISLDGVGDYVEVEDEIIFDITGDLTLACWIKVDNFTKVDQKLLTKGNYSYGLRRNGNKGSMCFYTSVGVIPGNLSVNDGQWHHVAGVYDGSKMYLYIDGVEDARVDATGNIADSNTLFMIGASGADSPEDAKAWNGLIDDVRVYTAALSSSEIATLTGIDNLRPYADAGDTQTIVWPVDFATMDATATDDGKPVGNELTYRWSKLSGPDAVTFDPDSKVLNPTVSFAAPGTYELYFEPNDGEKYSWDTVTINVFPEGFGLVAHWPMDYVAGDPNVYDISGNDYHGTEVGSPVYGTDRNGQANSALLFDGVNDEVSLNNHVSALSDLTSFTLAVWVKIPDTAEKTVFEWGNTGGADLMLAMLSGNYMRWGYNPAGVWWNSQSMTWDPGQWYHVAYVNDVTFGHIMYRDGAVVGTLPGYVTGPDDLSINNVVIGAYHGGVLRYKGAMDDMQLYDRALSQGELIRMAEVTNFCAEKLPNDLDGDCYVTLLDYALFAANWMECNNKLDSACSD